MAEWNSPAPLARRGGFELGSLQDAFQEVRLRHRPFQKTFPVDHRSGNPVDTVCACQFLKLSSLDTVGGNLVVLHRELMSQAHGLGAVRSGGRDENHQVKRFGELLESFPGLGFQSRVGLGDADDGIQKA